MSRQKHYDVGGIQITAYTGSVKKDVLICVHGFGGDAKSSVIEMLGKTLTDDGIVVIAFDLPCHGTDQSSGLLSLSRCTNYLERVEAWVREKFKGLPLSFFATSFGGHLLLHHLEKSDAEYKRLILRAPAVYMKEIMDTIIIQHGKSLDEIAKNPLNLGYEQELLGDKKFCEELTLPSYPKIRENQLYILQGKLDDLVNWKQNEKYFDKYYHGKHKFYYFEDADHRFKKPGQLDKIIEITREILK